MSNKKILVIAYFFPPASGVGGYRWAQMTKYLARLGLEIHVATVAWRQTTAATLRREVEHPNIHIHTVSSGYPHNLAVRDFGSRLLNGVRNKAFIHLINHFYPVDVTQHWGHFLIPFCKKLIVEHNITTVIATGPPFMVNVHAANLKLSIPNISLIHDIRDPWSNNKAAHYSEMMRNHLLKLEKFAFQNSNAIVTVTDGYKEILLKTTGQTPIHVINNGYDAEKFINTNHAAKSGGHITFAHLGSIYGNRLECAEAFLEFLRTFPQGKAIFAGSLPRCLLDKYADLIENGRFEFVGTISHEDCIKILNQAHFALHFNAKDTPGAASTKIYEYAAAGCPVLSFNFGNEPERLIHEHRLGISIKMGTPAINNSEIMRRILTFNNRNFLPCGIEKYSYANIAKDYLKLIQSI